MFNTERYDWRSLLALFIVEFGSFAEKMEFDDKDPDPREIISASTVSQQQPSTRTSQSIISSSHPRRSARIAHANCDDSATSSNERRMHRTQSGGVSHRNTSKTNIRRRSTNNRAASTIPSSIDRISTTLNNDLNIDDGIDTNTAPTGSLPSDQSDDDVSLSDTMRQNILSNARSDSNLLTRSEVLSYFDVKQDGFQCKLCKKVYQASKLSDSNLRKHLASSLHRISNVLFRSQTKDKPDNVSTTVSAERKRQLHDAAVSCIVKDGLPFDTFRKPGMSEFVSTASPGYRGPHRKTVRRKIGLLYAQHTAELREKLKSVECLALTSDIWKSPQRIYYICLTAHVQNEQFETIPLVLGCRRLIGRHSATNIVRYIRYELNRVGILKEQIVSITTDNGGDIKKATSSFEFGQRIACMAHNINLSIKKGLCLWTEPKQSDYPVDEDVDSNDWEDLDEDGCNDEDVFDPRETDHAEALVSDESEQETDSDATSGSYKSVDPADFDSEDDSGTKLPIFHHNDHGNSTFDTFDLLMRVNRTIRKTRQVVKLMRNNNIINEYLISLMSNNIGHKKNGLLLDMIIRWNSTFILVDRLIMHKDSVRNIFSLPNVLDGLNDKQKQALHRLTLSQDEWDILSAIRKVLEPFYVSTVVLSGRHYPTLSTAFYICRLLEKFLKSSNNDSSLMAALKHNLLRWFSFYNVTNLPVGQTKLMKMAAFLDPAIYNLMNDEDRIDARDLLFQQVRTEQLNFEPTFSRARKAPQSSSLCRLVQLCDDRQSNNLITSTHTTTTTTERIMTIDEEISCYVKLARTADCCETFWYEHGRSLPRLSRVVRRVTCIPATSVASEALFSTAGFLVRKNRSGMSSSALRHCIVLKDRHLLQKLN